MAGPATTRRQLVWFFILAYGLSWVIAAPMVLARWGAVNITPPEWLHVFVPLGPAIAAVSTTAAYSGHQGLVSLWHRCTRPGIVPHRGWWLIALAPIGLLIPGLALAVPIERLNWSNLTSSNLFSGTRWITMWVVASVSFGVLEEVGWRGFALPRMQGRQGAATASAWLWLLWSGWHLPMFVYHFDLSPLMALAWGVTLYFGTVLLTFLHNGAAGSVLVPIVWHVGYDLVSIPTGEISALLPALMGAMIVIGVIAIARRYGPADLSPRPRYVLSA